MLNRAWPIGPGLKTRAPQSDGYSVRIATIGSTRPARRAGTHAANMAAVSSSAAAAARLIGSNGLT